MKQEIEVKLRVVDAAATRRLLGRLGGRVLRRVHEMNTLFDTPRGTLRKRGRLLRLRVETPLAGHRRRRFILTLKGPSRPDTRYKVRAEMERILPDARGFLGGVAALGLRPVFRYEKRRTSYGIPAARGVHVEFDETPAGFFLELEGARRAIDRLARRLGYGPADYIAKSYLALHFDDCRRRGRAARDMLFGAKKK